MYRLEAAMPVKVRRERRRNTTIKANIRDECLGLLSMSTKNGEGLWGAVVGGETVTIFAMRQMPALSRIVHSWALARTDRERSWEQFAHALESDVADVQGGTTAEGIHLGAMAGTVDLLQRGYAGLEARRDALWFDPALPKELRSLEFEMHYRGHRLQVRITPDLLHLATIPSEVAPIRIGFGDEVRELAPGSTAEWALGDPA